MELRLNDETRRRIDEYMRRNGFASAEDTVLAALDALDRTTEDELDDATLDAIERGLTQADAGQSRPWSEIRANLARGT
jgi:predicted transcriptional regulator